MFERLGLQLYTVRDYMQDEKAIDETFEKLAKIGYTEAQTAGNYIENPVFVKLAEKHGIKIVGTHYDFGKIVNSPCETMKYHDLLGTKNVGIGGMPSEARKDYDSLMKFIGIFNKTAEIYAKNGFRLTYHNHSFEFAG